MNLLSYFHLRSAQHVLCVSYSVPAAIFMTTAFSPFGTWSVSWFFVYLMTLMALTWGGLALYTRETDRIRHLTVSPETFIRSGKTVVAGMRQHEKARLIWEVLQDDEVIRRQLQAWWRGVARFLSLSVDHLPSVILMTVCLAFWIFPEEVGVLVDHLRECPAESVVRWTAGALTSMYIITGLGWVMCDVVMNRLPVNCFREAFLAKVAAYQQHDDDTSFSGTDAAAEHAELREGGK